MQPNYMLLSWRTNAFGWHETVLDNSAESTLMVSWKLPGERGESSGARIGLCSRNADHTMGYSSGKPVVPGEQHDVV